MRRLVLQLIYSVASAVFAISATVRIWRGEDYYDQMQLSLLFYILCEVLE